MAARVRVAQNAFSKGELSPRLHNRTEIPAYLHGCKICENWTLLPQGGVRMRPGTKWVAATKFADKVTELLPFQFNDEQSYVLEVGDEYIRFFRNSAAISVPETDAAIANGDFTTDLTSWTQRNTGTGATSAQNAGTVLLTGPTSGEGRGAVYQAVAIGAAYRSLLHVLRFKVTEGTAAMRIGYEPGGEQVQAALEFGTGEHVREFTPNLPATVDSTAIQIDVVAAARTFTRLAGSFVADGFAIGQPIIMSGFTNGGNNVTKIIETVSATVITVTSGTGLVNETGGGDERIQTVTSVYIEFAEEVLNETSRVDNVAFLSDQPVELISPYVEAELFEFQHDQSADIMWIAHRNHKPRELRRMGNSSWSLVEYQPENDPFVIAAAYPRAVCLWKSRLWWGGTNANPQKIWGTKVDDFQSLDPGTVLDDEAIERTIASGKVNVIQWMLAAGKQMVVGTYGSEMLVTGDANGLVTPKNIQIDPSTEHGSNLVRGISAASATVFLQRNRRRLRRLAYNFNEDKFQAADLMLEYNHLTSEFPLIQLSQFEDPDPVIWAVREDGQLLGMSIDVQQKILGWGRHTTQGQFKSICTIPHPSGQQDQSWVIVDRVINGDAVKYIEFFEELDGFYGQLHTDCTLTGDFETPQDSVTGLDHLEGETVRIVGDGAVYPEQTVIDGEVILDPPASFIEVGLGYDAILETLRASLGAQQSINGLTVDLADLVLHVLNTITLEVNGVILPDRSSEDLMDAPPPLFTGDIPVPVLGSGADASSIRIVQSNPLPTTILAVSAFLTVGDG